MEKYSIDFDSAYTNIYKIGSGLVLSEPTVASVEELNSVNVKAIGEEAYKLIGKTSKNTKTVFPVFEGEIVNVKVASGLLGGLLKKVGYKSRIVGSSAIFPVPCGVTPEIIESYQKVAKNVGLSKVYFAEAPILSALGQRIPFNDSAPCFLIDMAGGTTNIAALSLDGIITGVSTNFGGNKVTTDIIDYIVERFGLQIGLQTAERLKKEIGSLEEGDGLSTVVNGRDLATGSPKALSIKAMDIIEPIKKYYDKVSEIAMTVLKKLPPEVSAEIKHAGIYVSGSASSVYGLQRYLNQKFDMQVNVAESPMYSVALGGGIALGNNDLLKKIAIKF